MTIEKSVLIKRTREGCLDPEEIPILIKEGTTAEQILVSLGLPEYRLSWWFCFLDDQINVYDLVNKEDAILFASPNPMKERRNSTCLALRP
jgi:hypothetical protein